MPEQHSLLRRQLKRHTAHTGELPEEWRAFIDAVNDAYRQSDVDREMLERSMNLSSAELMRANADLRDVVRALKQSELEYRGLFEAARDAILILDPADGRVLEANQRACEIYGFTRDEFLDLSITHFTEDVGAALARIEATLQSGVHPGFESVHRNKAGTRMHVEVSDSVVTYKGQPAILSINHDVTDRHKARTELQESLSLLRATLESTADGILVVDREGRFVTFNRRFVEMWGFSREIVEAGDDGQAIEMALEQLHRPDTFLEKVRELYAQPDAESQDILEFKDGRVFERYSMPQRIGGESVGRVWSFRDVTQQRRAEEVIQHHAYHDDLTGLPNRPLFRDRLSQALAQAQRFKQTLAMLFFDLDRFKIINDTLGHDVGDRLLQDVAKRLIERRRAGDTLARLGGDEFMLLVSNIRHVGDAKTIAEDFLDALRPAFQVGGHELHIAASCGISIYPHDGEDAETLVKNADIALYQAKARGRNAYQVYEPEMNAKALGKLVLENQLRRALAREEFVVYYQPVISGRDGSVVATEALVRWRRDGQLVLPAEFISVAEASGLIGPLGDWVLAQACVQRQHWLGIADTPMRMSVNVSASQFQQQGFFDEVRRALEVTGLDPSTLELELTESVILQHPDEGIASLRALASLGVQIAIDDFGTGYSSLSYLKRLPISALKIDQSFIRDCISHRNDAAIVTAVIAMAQSMNLRVVAEGVETPEQAAFLRERGCDELQGFLFSPPIAEPELTAMLEQRVRSAT